MLKKDRRGLSAVVTTLIIVLLVIVALGIVWTVLRNVIDKGATDIQSGANCLNINVKITNVVENPASSGDYDVTLTRKSDGGQTLGGLKVVFFNGATNASSVVDSSGNLEVLGTETRTLSGTGFPGATKVEYTPYLLNDNNEEVICQTDSYTI